MTPPRRLRWARPPEVARARFSRLYAAIAERAPGWEEVLSEWRAHAARPVPEPFPRFADPADRELFLLQALTPPPVLDPALTWDELVSVVDAALGDALEEPERRHLLEVLEANLPGADVVGLIEWPGEWFGNRWFEEATLTPDQVAAYALARCGRELPGAPLDLDDLEEGP